MFEPKQNDLMLGLGCERETPCELLERGIERVFAQHGLSPAHIYAIGTIDRKRDERGLLALSARRGWPLWFYSAAQLRDVLSEPNERVQAHVSTPAVAEPAARLLAGTDELLVSKTIYTERGLGRSMTIAVARMRVPPNG